MSANDNDNDDEETVRLRHDGRATVWGGPADLDATDPGDEVVVAADAADHYVDHHGFTVVEDDADADAGAEETAEAAEAEPETEAEGEFESAEPAEPDPVDALADADYRELQALAQEVEGISATQSADALREALVEHYESEE